jgi:hypothetical protein
MEIDSDGNGRGRFHPLVDGENSASQTVIGLTGRGFIKLP